MGIYTVNGDSILTCYDVNGDQLNKAYDVDGSEVFFAGAQTIKVCQYNCGQWYDGGHDNVPADKDEAYYFLQLGMLEQIDADVICLEEYTQQFSKAGRTARSVLEEIYPYIHEQAGTTTTEITGRCIASKYPISNYTTHQYVQSGSPRYFDSCTITVESVPITFVVTHLSYNASSNTARVAQLAELITFLQGIQGRFVCCGDLNTLSCKTTTDADYQAMMTQIINAGFKAANCMDFGFIETYSDQPLSAWTGCLDNIIIPPNMIFLSVSVDTTKLNDGLTDKVDHMPLVAVIEL